MYTGWVICLLLFKWSPVYNSHLSTAATCLQQPPVYCSHLSPTTTTCLLQPPVSNNYHLSTAVTCLLQSPMQVISYVTLYLCIFLHTVCMYMAYLVYVHVCTCVYVPMCECVYTYTHVHVLTYLSGYQCMTCSLTSTHFFCLQSLRISFVIKEAQ